MTGDLQARLDLVRGAILAKRDSWSQVLEIYSRRPGDHTEILQRCRTEIKEYGQLLDMIDGTEG